MNYMTRKLIRKVRTRNKLEQSYVYVYWREQKDLEVEDDDKIHQEYTYLEIKISNDEDTGRGYKRQGNTRQEDR